VWISVHLGLLLLSPDRKDAGYASRTESHSRISFARSARCYRRSARRNNRRGGGSENDDADDEKDDVRADERHDGRGAPAWGDMNGDDEGLRRSP
jgi:hypothetical protein